VRCVKMGYWYFIVKAHLFPGNEAKKKESEVGRKQRVIQNGRKKVESDSARSEVVSYSSYKDEKKKASIQMWGGKQRGAKNATTSKIEKISFRTQGQHTVEGHSHRLGKSRYSEEKGKEQAE